MNPGRDARLELKLDHRGPVLYKGVKGVNEAARPPEGGPAETGGLSGSNLPLMDNAPSDTNARQPR